MEANQEHITSEARTSLVLTRHIGEGVVLTFDGLEIGRIKVHRIRKFCRNQARWELKLHFQCPNYVGVWREEIPVRRSARCNTLSDLVLARYEGEGIVLTLNDQELGHIEVLQVTETTARLRFLLPRAIVVDRYTAPE